MNHIKPHTLLCVLFLIILISCDNLSQKNYSPEEKQAINTFVKNINDTDSLQALIKQYEIEGSKYGLIAVYNAIGKKQNGKSNFNQAIDYYNKSLEIAEALKDTIEIVKALNNIGFSVRRLGSFDESANYYYRILGLCDTYSGDNHEEINENRLNALNSIGNIHKWLGNIEAADSIFRITIEGEHEMGNLKGLAKNYANLASIFKEKEQLDSAWVYYRRSMEYSIEINDKYGIELSHVNFGNMYRLEEKYDEALAEYHIVFDQLNENENRWHWLSVCIALTRVNILKGDYTTVLPYLDKAQLIAEEIRSYTHLSDIAYMRYMYYKEKGNYRLALDNYVQTYHWSDSLRNEENTSHLQNLRVSFEREKNARKMEQQDMEIKRQNTQRRIFAIGLTISLLMLSMLWYMLQLRTKRNRALMEMNATKDKFFSIISHDLKNPAIAQRDALQLLVTHSTEWNTELLSQYYNELLKSADGQVELLYNLLNWAQVQTGRMPYTPIPFDIVATLRSDITLIENLAKRKGILFDIQMPETAIVTGDSNMITTVVRNLLTNAIKFTSANQTISLRIEPQENNGYIIIVSDTGIGMSEKQMHDLFTLGNQRSQRGTNGESGSGLGLIVCKELIKKHQSVLQVESQEGKGSTFKFSLK